MESIKVLRFAKGEKIVAQPGFWLLASLISSHFKRWS
jgi:hypothetical protein